MTKKGGDVIKLQQQIVELTEALQRERADAMNVRRRSEEERTRLGSYHKAHVVKELLPVIDNFERALKHAPGKGGEQRAEGEAEKKLYEWIDGVNKIVTQFEHVLEKIGVKRIKTVGEPFDPNLHEAISMEEGDPSTSSGQGGEDVVSEELQAGYILGDEVIRHAMVKVKAQ